MNVYRLVSYIAIAASGFLGIAGAYDPAILAAIQALFWWTVADRAEWEEEQ